MQCSAFYARYTLRCCVHINRRAKHFSRAVAVCSHCVNNALRVHFVPLLRVPFCIRYLRAYHVIHRLWRSCMRRCKRPVQFPTLCRPISGRPIGYRHLRCRPTCYRPTLYRPIGYRLIRSRRINYRPMRYRPKAERPIFYRSMLYMPMPYRPFRYRPTNLKAFCA